MLAADYGFSSLHTSHIETHDHTGFEPVLGNAGDVHTVRQQSTMIDGELLALEESPNLRLISAYVRDGLGNPITSPYLGQRVAIQVQFEATHLPSDATHAFHFTVDGVTLGSGILTTGAGEAALTGFRWRAGWFATSGTHQVVVKTDAFNTVAESDESDNTLSFSFTTVRAAFPQPLRWPVEGTPYSNHAFLNYVDVDPTDADVDFRGNSYTYDRHSAWDIAVRGYDEQDAGIEIYAAADGVVIDTHDGEFDRQTNLGPVFPPVNYVVVDHGGGWTTRYVHLRRDSVQVQVGDSVSAGDQLGYMASSGWSDITHLHFSLEHFGFSVEPWYDPTTYLAPSVASLQYIGENQYVLSSGISNVPVAAHLREGTSQVHQFEQKSGQLVYSWNWFSGVEQGDAIRLEWRRPDDSLYRTSGTTAANDWAHQWRWFSQFLPSVPDLGIWTIDVLVNNAKIHEQSFEVSTTGVPEARVLQADDLIVDDRVTPIDFGSVTQFATAPRQSFVIENHGEAQLNIGSVGLPAGFRMLDPIVPSLAVGQSDTFSIEMSTQTLGYRGGQVRIETNDEDEGSYAFSIEGVVTSAIAQKLFLGINERKTSEGSTVFGNVRRTDHGAGLDASLVVNLLSNNASVSVPASVTIPAGWDRVVFPIVTVQDGFDTVDQVVQLSAFSGLTPPATNELLLQNAVLPPTVTGVLTNQGNMSRSRLETIRVAFDRQVAVDVNGPTPVAKIRNKSTQALVPIDLAVAVENSVTVLQITVMDPTSVPDGNYTLWLDASTIIADGLSLDGNANGFIDASDDFEFGTTPADAFFKHFGDTDGDRDVDGQDHGRFGLTLYKSTGQGGFNEHFDSDGDGDVDGQDYGRFVRRLLKSLPF